MNSFHVHSDTHLLSSFYKVPLCHFMKGDVYIMQEDRLVYLGSVKGAENFIIRNKDKYCKGIYERV